MRNIVLFLLILTITTSIVTAQESITIAEPPLAPGEMIDVGGYRLHLYCVGEGSPTVILEPGFARFSLNWRTLQTALAGSTRVCTYDHAGFGWSDAGTMPRTTQQLSDELALLLENGNVEAPYLLVAHSLGGFVARLFAAQHASDVAGVILLDATPPDFWNNPEIAAQNTMLEMILMATLATAHSGEWNQQTIAPVLQLLSDVPPEFHNDYLALATRPAHIEAALNEWQNRTNNAQQVSEAAFPADMPLIVLAAGDRLALNGTTDADWVRGQLAQAQLSHRNELRFIVGGNHDFYVTQPEIVVNTVQQFLQQ